MPNRRTKEDELAAILSKYGVAGPKSGGGGGGGLPPWFSSMYGDNWREKPSNSFKFSSMMMGQRDWIKRLAEEKRLAEAGLGKKSGPGLTTSDRPFYVPGIGWMRPKTGGGGGGGSSWWGSPSAADFYRWFK